MTARELLRVIEARRTEIRPILARFETVQCDDCCEFVPVHTAHCVGGLWYCNAVHE